MASEKYDWKYQIKERLFYLLSSKNIPSNNLLINCTPRSGSTWLFDALRSHPKIIFQKKAAFHARFNIKGNRYPEDMTIKESPGELIEVKPKRVRKIRSLQLPTVSMHDKLEAISLEKIHPHFYNYDSAAFLGEIKKQRDRGKRFKFITLVRNPNSTFLSILNYRKRNPNWFAEANVNNLEPLLTNTFQALLDMTKQADDVLVIDYEQLFSEPEVVLQNCFELIWPENQYLLSAQAKADIDGALRLTDRKKIKSSSQVFIKDYDRNQKTPIDPSGKLMEIYKQLLDKA